MLQCGLLGKTLSHSFSPQIHQRLFHSYAYTLFEQQPESLGAFLQSGAFHGMNVTIPYKEAVLPYCARLSDIARRVGAVNTLVRETNGSLSGYNTDYYGFLFLLSTHGISVAGKHAVVMGSGGAGKMAATALADLGAARVTVLSRGGQPSYADITPYADAQLLVNTTPVGMYPHNEDNLLLDPCAFPQLEAVVDLIFNPAKTRLLLAAERHTNFVITANGLSMLTAQAALAGRLFLGLDANDDPRRLLPTAPHTALTPNPVSSDDATHAHPALTPNSALSDDATHAHTALTPNPVLSDDATHAHTALTPNPVPSDDATDLIKRIHTVTQQLATETTNLVLIGMPGSGKSTIGRLLAAQLRRPFLDTDSMVEEAIGMPVPTIFETHGEHAFRAAEAEAAQRAGKQTGVVIATGGGLLLRPANKDALAQNGHFVFLRRPLSALATNGRPLSTDLSALKQLYQTRLPLYEAAADRTVDVTGTPQEVVETILRPLF